MKDSVKGSSRGSIVSFHDLSYKVKLWKIPWGCSASVTVLSKLNGFMPPGMNAVMGPTGCGKSSLLDALAGRKNPKQLSGRVFLNGKSQSAHLRRHNCGYVVQDSIAVNTLTVRENIAFSAALRLSSRQLAVCDKQTRVNRVIEELSLAAVADRLLGTVLHRGVSGGERKRTCIGIELVKDPLVLYLDEPTTGLDAYTAHSVMETLKRLADAGRTIVFSIHQPKYSIYRLFDRLTLLADGQIVYHGPADRKPLDYFRQYGYLIEGFDNPADFFMDILHGEVTITQNNGVVTGDVLPHRVETDDEGTAHCTNESNADMLLRTNDLSPRELLTHSLIILWKQSGMWKQCLAVLSSITKKHDSGENDAFGRVGCIMRDSGSTSSLSVGVTPQHNQVSVRASRIITAPVRECALSESDQNLPVGSSNASTGNLPTQSSPFIDFKEVNSLPAENPAIPTSQDHLHKSDPLPTIDLEASHSTVTFRKPNNVRWGCGSHQIGVTGDRRCDKCIPEQLPYAVSYSRQLTELSRRQFLSMLRDYRPLLMHFLIQLIIAVFLGTMYFNLGHSIESGIQNRTGLFFLTCLQLLFINTSMLETFLKDRAIFMHETSSGFYSVSVYLVAKLISEVLPTKALPAALFLPITYLMSGLRSSWHAFGFWQLTITSLTITASTIAFSVSAMVTNFRLGSTLLSMFFVLTMITSGYLINVLSLGIWLRWLRHISVIRLAMNVLLINELVGVQFCPTSARQSRVVMIGEVTHHKPSELELITPDLLSWVEHGNFTNAGCISGEHYLVTQSIEYESNWVIWQNQLGILLVFVLALINAYVYLRLMRKYK